MSDLLRGLAGRTLIYELEISRRQIGGDFCFRMSVQVGAVAVEFGHDGGAVALAFTATYPDRVRTLALSEPAVIPSPAWMRQEAAPRSNAASIWLRIRASSGETSRVGPAP